MEESPTGFQVLINWLPFLVYLAVTLYLAALFRKYMAQRLAFQKELLEHLRCHSEAIERLATTRGS